MRRRWTSAVQALALALALVAVPRAAVAQSLPVTRADELLRAGRWAEAEDAYYEESRISPREPVPRAALGRFLATKGAVLPGSILIEEAGKFGLDQRTTQSLLRPLRRVLDWRRAAGDLRGDTTIAFVAPRDSTALFRIALRAPGAASGRGAAIPESAWYDLVPRGIGLDSVNAPNHPVGVEVLELLVPAVTVGAGQVTLHANPRDALAAAGRRYPVLRTERGIQVLVQERRVLDLVAALRELAPAWWQLDLAHGLLVVR